MSISSSRAGFEVVGCSLLLCRCTSVVWLHLQASTVVHSALAKCKAGLQLHLPGFSWQVCTQHLVSGHHQQNTNSTWVVWKNFAPPSPLKHTLVCRHTRKKYEIWLLWKQTWTMAFFSPLWKRMAPISWLSCAQWHRKCGAVSEVQKALKTRECVPPTILPCNLSPFSAQSRG